MGINLKNLMKATDQNLRPISDGTNRLLKDYIEATRNGLEDSISTTSTQLKEDILAKVKQALENLYANDVCLLKEGMNELTVSGRLAIYLHEKFSDFIKYFVDIEYYRLTIPKKDVNDLRKNRIRCDILLHSRGHYERKVDNLLAIEIKLEKSNDDGNYDKNRLAELVIPETPNTPENAVHSTLVGLYLRLGEDGYSDVQFSSQGYTPMNNDNHRDQAQQ